MCRRASGAGVEDSSREFAASGRRRLEATQPSSSWVYKDARNGRVVDTSGSGRKSLASLATFVAECA